MPTVVATRNATREVVVKRRDTLAVGGGRSAVQVAGPATAVQPVVDRTRVIGVSSTGMQGPSGPPGANSGEPVTTSYVSAHHATLLKGQPVCVVSGQLRLGSAQFDRYEFSGLVYEETIVPGASGRVQIDGLMVLPSNQWDVVLGTVGGLVAETTYFLQPGGNMAHTAPTSGGLVLVAAGYALSATEFMIEPARPVFL